MIPKKWHHRRNTGHTKAWKFYSTENYKCGKLKKFSSVKIFVTLWYGTTKRPKNGPEKNFVNKNFPHLKILPLTADEIFGLRYEDGKMPSSNNFRVFIILKGANYFGNELDNAQSEYGATLSPAPYFFLIRWEPLFGSGAQANKFSLVLSFAKRNMTVKFKTREILFKKMINFLLVK